MYSSKIVKQSNDEKPHTDQIIWIKVMRGVYLHFAQ